MFRQILTAAFVVVFAFTARAGLVTLDFEGLSVGGQPGDLYPGIDFFYGNAGDDAAVGDLLAFSDLRSGFQITQGPFVISGSNAVSCFPTSFGPPQAETLMAFAVPVTTVSLVTDDAFGETADIVRLLALEATANPLEFRILAIDEGTDDGTTIQANTLTLRLDTPFSFAAFQRTSEAESFDDLTFGTHSVPEPSSALIFIVACGIVGVVRRNRVGR